MIGEKDEVVKEYTTFINWFNKLSKQEQKIYRNEMLDGQKNVKIPPVIVNGSIVASRSKPNKITNRSLYLQFGILFTMFLMATLLLFV